VRWSVIRRKLGRADRLLAKAIEKGEIPGAVVLARMPREGELVEYEAVVGNAVVRPERVAMRRDTIFDLASLTKPLATTGALLLLAADGLVDLDDPVAKHLPAFAEREKEGVTIRHLLTHSSGLKPLRFFHEELLERERKKGERWIGEVATKPWVIERICKSKPVHEPGEAAVYGDLDFIVLGALVEALAGEPLDALCRRRIFEPLGMADTGFVPLGRNGPVALDPARRARTAATEQCEWRERILWGEVHDPNASVMGGVAGHAGLFSTADDVMREALAWLDAWHGRDSIFPTDWVRRFFERQDLPPGSDWALGWDTPTEGQSSSGHHFGRPSVGHLGFTGTSLWMDLERELVVVVLTNRIHPIVKRARFGLRPKLHDRIVEAFVAE
jgi:CubicO group peptidase (beta-lactamase class C family)